MPGYPHFEAFREKRKPNGLYKRALIVVGGYLLMEYVLFVFVVFVKDKNLKFTLMFRS